MTANVSIVVEHKDDVLQIKNAALRYRPVETGSSGTKSAPSPGRKRSGAAGEHRNQRTVYVLRGGADHPEPVQIKTGISDGIVTEVVDGLKEGDRAVTAEFTRAADSGPANPFSGGRRFH